jgi:hypothetical protein
MKFLLTILLLPVLLFAWDGHSRDNSWYNSHDESITEYTIYTAAELAELAHLVNNGHSFSGKTVKLGANINLGSHEWTPIGAHNNEHTFQGTFDGQGHVVSGLSITHSNDYHGLFGKVDNARINRLGVQGSVAGGNYVGGIVGYGAREILNSYFEGSVSGVSNVGGLIGYSAHDVINSYATGSVASTGNSSTGSYIGGIVGGGANTLRVINSYFAGTVSTPHSNRGGITGNVSGATVANSYHYNSNNYTTGGGTARTQANMKTKNFADWLSFYAARQNEENASNNYAEFVHREDNYPTLSTARASASEYFSSGNGTSATPYVITTKSHLRYLSDFTNEGYGFQGLYIKLGEDIELNDTASRNGWRDWTHSMTGLEQWVPIGTIANYFRGTFDGNGKVVRGLYISSANECQGLFGYLNGATIKNLGVVGFYARGSNSTGGIAGGANSSTSQIINSYAIGNVVGTQGYFGGIVGSNAKVFNSYFAGNVYGVGPNPLSNIVGATATATNSFFNSDSIIGSGAGTPKTTAEMRDISFSDILQIYAGLNNYDMGWAYNDDGYPTLSGSGALAIADYFESGAGTSENPYIIVNKAQLKNLSLLVSSGRDFQNEYIKLGANIELNDTTGWESWGESSEGLEEWEPIGTNTSGKNFNGFFDGNGYVVSGLYINKPDSDYQGLFGYIDNARDIKNLGLKAFYVRGKNYVGGLAGYGRVNNSYAVGNVKGNDNVGGLTGSYSTSNGFNNNYAVGNVSGNRYVGGLAGRNPSGYSGIGAPTIIMSNSYFIGNVSGDSDVGGLIGFKGVNTSLSNSYYNNNNTGTNEAEMKNIDTYIANWDFNSTWTMQPNSYPTLRVFNHNPATHISDASYALINQRLNEDGTPTTIELRTGSPIRPGIRSGSVFIEGTPLIEGTDYLVSYKNNTDASNTNPKIVLVGIGNYTGTKEITFRIVDPKRSIGTTNTSITVSAIPEQLVTGEPIEPEPVIKDNLGELITLRKGTDYSLSYSNNINVGTATITVTGLGSIYENSARTITFQIVPNKNLATAAMTIDGPAYYPYTGEAITPRVVIIDPENPGVPLTLNVDYTLEYENNVNVSGVAKIIAHGMGRYANSSKYIYFPITEINLEPSMLMPIQDQEYTGGNPITPSLAIFYGENILRQGTDYTVSYENNTNIGTASVTITGKNNYVGTINATFNIVDIIAKDYINIEWNPLSFTYNGSVQRPSGIALNSEGLPVLLNITSGETINASNTPYIASASLAVENPAYILLNPSVQFHINKAPIQPTLHISDVKENQQLRPSVEGNSGNGPITIYYSTERNGTYITNTPVTRGIYYAKAIIGQTNNYEGAETEIISFAITSNNLISIPVAWDIENPSFVYNGTEQGPTAIASLDGTAFGLVINKAVNAGYYLATARLAKPSVEHELTNSMKIFTITPKPLDEDAIEPIDNFSFINQQIKPPVIVRDGNKTLVENKDYTVEYGNNIVSSGSVRVIGIGNYTGIAERTFQISSPGAKVVNIVWGNAVFEYNGEEQAPEVIAIMEDNQPIEIEIEVLGKRRNAGGYTAVASLITNDPSIILANASKPYTIARKQLEVSWTEQRAFEYNNAIQHPIPSINEDEIIEGDEVGFELLNVASEAGSHNALYVITGKDANNYLLQNYSAEYSINRKQFTVSWGAEREFTYNKKVQCPEAKILDDIGNEANIPYIILNCQSEAGVYTGATAAIIQFKEQEHNENYLLLSRSVSYEIVKKSLIPYFSAELPNFEINADADTLWVPREIFSNAAFMQAVLGNLINYNGFATDDKGKSDDVSVLKGTPKILLEYPSSSPFTLAKRARVETSLKATATIATDDVSADNYALTRPAIIIMETIDESEQTTSLSCYRGNYCAEVSDEVCRLINGEEVPSCSSLTITCIIDDIEVKNMLLTQCTNMGGRVFEEANLGGSPITPMPNTYRLSPATYYYNLKGEPLGTAKPITPGVYIEKSGKIARKILVK